MRANVAVYVIKYLESFYLSAFTSFIYSFQSLFSSLSLPPSLSAVCLSLSNNLKKLQYAHIPGRVKGEEAKTSSCDLFFFFLRRKSFQVLLHLLARLCPMASYDQITRKTVFQFPTLIVQEGKTRGGWKWRNYLPGNRIQAYK